MSHFATLEFARRLHAPPAVLWQAWIAPMARQIWSNPGEGVEIETLEADNRLGGREIALCRAPGSPELRIESLWLDITRPHQTVNVEQVIGPEGPLSAALVTARIETGPEGDGLLRLTVQLSAGDSEMEAGYRAGFTAGLAQLAALIPRMMVIEREIAAPPTRLWQAWADPLTLSGWWGPEGFSCRTQRMDLRPGGEWLFDMIGPDGTVYPNHHHYQHMHPDRGLGYTLHWGEDGPKHAEAWAEFTPTSDGSLVTLAMIFATEAECRDAKAMGAEALGLQTLGKLARAAGAA